MDEYRYSDCGIYTRIFVADIKSKKKIAKKILFTFYWEEAGNWENKNYSVEIKMIKTCIFINYQSVFNSKASGS